MSKMEEKSYSCLWAVVAFVAALYFVLTAATFVGNQIVSVACFVIAVVLLTVSCFQAVSCVRKK
jgi:hypothetical protein